MREECPFDFAAAGAVSASCVTTSRRAPGLAASWRPHQRAQAASSAWASAPGENESARPVRSSDLPPLAPGIEDIALGGQDAVKTGQKQRRARWPGSVFKQRNQFERQTGGAEQVAGAAGFVEGCEPFAEGRRILLPAGSGRGSQELWRVSAEQFVGIHGQAGQAVARAFEQSAAR